MIGATSRVKLGAATVPASALPPARRATPSTGSATAPSTASASRPRREGRGAVGVVFDATACRIVRAGGGPGCPALRRVVRSPELAQRVADLADGASCAQRLPDRRKEVRVRLGDPAHLLE